MESINTCVFPVCFKPTYIQSHHLHLTTLSKQGESLAAVISAPSAPFHPLPHVLCVFGILICTLSHSAFLASWSLLGLSPLPPASTPPPCSALPLLSLRGSGILCNTVFAPPYPPHFLPSSFPPPFSLPSSASLIIHLPLYFYFQPISTIYEEKSNFSNPKKIHTICYHAPHTHSSALCRQTCRGNYLSLTSLLPVSSSLIHDNLLTNPQAPRLLPGREDHSTLACRGQFSLKFSV